MQFTQLVWRGSLATITLGALAVGGVYAATEYQMRHRVPIPAAINLHVPRDSATIARGAHLVRNVNGCAECHGSDLGGRLMLDEPMVMRLVASNLTAGRGGKLPSYDDQALVNAIRHGVAPDGRVLRFMPSHEFSEMADDDVAAIIAYMREQPAVDRELPPLWAGPVIRALSVAGQVALFPYYRIDHDRRPLAAAPVGASEEHGRYLARGCIGCHGDGLGGGKIPGAPPDWPAAANLTPTGIGTWSEEDFVRTLRTGINPSGAALRPPMGWQAMARMTDDELKSLYMYLATIAPRPTGSR